MRSRHAGVPGVDARIGFALYGRIIDVLFLHLLPGVLCLSA